MKRFVTAITLAFAAGICMGGDLNPPAGAISPTPGVLFSPIDVETLPAGGGCKYLISAPGSYYLRRNITMSTNGLGGISIQASDVTLDLNGFELAPGPTTTGTGDGISGDIGSNKKCIVIRNGSIRGWGLEGIDLHNTATFSGIIENIRVCNNAGIGIGAGESYIVRNCTATGNGAGIYVSPGSALIDCTSYNNNGDGFFLNIGSAIQGCTAFKNVGNGIQVTSGCRVVGNNCRENGYLAGTGSGILAGNANGAGGNRIEQNNCTANDFGIRVTSNNNWVVGNTCNTNTTNWFVNATPNLIALIVDFRSQPLGAINGDTGGNWDGGCCYNFSY